ncbi:hypothetical protein [Catellatospora sichuanensis]|uniref:hypothetical protein n=1 Tax=Catellatospora sichuanensis TaxID=1969805 RepID=UPI001181FAD6|nr:hypothetical protein [Catellatospora sichuanensis]
MTDIPSPVMTSTPDAPVVAEPPRHGLAWSLRHLAAVLGTVGSALLRHWPALLALVFLGFAARRGLVVVAVQASKLDGVFGFLVFALVPVAVMTALVLMLRVLSRSLPAMAATGEPGERFRALAHIASVLLPFIAVYASYGYFEADRNQYVYEVYADETFNNDADIFANPAAVNIDERLPFQLNATLVIVVGVAMALRFLLGLRPGRLWGWVGFVRAYLEVLSITLFAAFVSTVSKLFVPYVEARQGYQWALGLWHALVDQMGPLKAATQAAGLFLAGLFFSIDTVLVVPIAWLVVGTVVYGQSLGTPPLSAKAARRARSAVRRWVRFPAPVRRLARGSTASLRESTAPLAHAFRLLAHAGKVPILLFCLLFTALQTLPSWLWELERELVGPGDLQFYWVPLSGPLALFNQAISMVLQLCLVAATVDRVLRVQSAGQAEPDVAHRQVEAAEAEPHRDRVDAGGQGEVGHGPVAA